MKLWMHGLGPDSDQGAALIKEMGFSAVVGSVKNAEAALAHGLEAYLCSGAYRGPSFQGEDWLARDTKNHPQEWFSSTCPTRREVRQYNLEQIEKMAKTPGIRGILIDGARFASPSSNDTPECFYTCFCPSCRKKMTSLGFDPAALEKAVDALYDYLHGVNLDLVPYREDLMKWLTFRRLATTEHLTDFTNVVRGVDPDLLCGIYIFAPSFSHLVGQSYRDADKIMDLISPMLYRAYSDVHGASCLNAESAAIMTMLDGALSLTRAQKAGIFRALTGLPSNDETDVPALEKGFGPEVLQLETSRAKAMLTQSHLVPIIQLDDPLLEEASRQAMAGGAEAVNFFVFDQAEIEKHVDFFERNKKAR